MKNLAKFACIMLLVLVFSTRIMNVYAETLDETIIQMTDTTASPESTPLPELTEEPAEVPVSAAEETSVLDETTAPVETIAPEMTAQPSDKEIIMALLDADRSVSISASWEAERLGIGDEIILRATAKGYEKVDYEFIFQASADGITWNDQATTQDDTFTYTLSETNYTWTWRVVVVIRGIAN